MPRLIHYLLLLSSLAAFTPAQAEIFRCLNAQGETVFQDSPCAPGSMEEQELDLDPNANTFQSRTAPKTTKSVVKASKKTEAQDGEAKEPKENLESEYDGSGYFRGYPVQAGPRGGLYIVKDGKKVYISSYKKD